MNHKLSQELAEKFALYNGLLEKIESEFDHLEPKWNPEGGWYPTEFKSNDPYKPGKLYNILDFWMRKTFLEVDYQNEDACISVSFDHKTWTEEEIQQRENNPLLAYYEPFLKTEELDYLTRELEFYWGLGR
jgi:hypothetical protein